jgi:hypothetical protein
MIAMTPSENAPRHSGVGFVLAARCTALCGIHPCSAETRGTRNSEGIAADRRA